MSKFIQEAVVLSVYIPPAEETERPSNCFLAPLTLSCHLLNWRERKDHEVGQKEGSISVEESIMQKEKSFNKKEDKVDSAPCFEASWVGRHIQPAIHPVSQFDAHEEAIPTIRNKLSESTFKMALKALREGHAPLKDQRTPAISSSWMSPSRAETMDADQETDSLWIGSRVRKLSHFFNSKANMDTPNDLASLAADFSLRTTKEQLMNMSYPENLGHHHPFEARESQSAFFEWEVEEREWADGRSAWID